jgi:hypothetical protein
MSMPLAATDPTVGAPMVGAAAPKSVPEDEGLAALEELENPN